jgi:hypothetical protein
MTVAAWSPLADGILSGKFSAANTAEPGTRIDPATLSDHQRGIAALVQEVAGDIGATPAQVAIAWTMARSPAIHPIIGARRPHQCRKPRSEPAATASRSRTSSTQNGGYRAGRRFDLQARPLSQAPIWPGPWRVQRPDGNTAHDPLRLS